ncbi:alpha/beta fold hydrolase [Streptomyces chartreusis]|uniref:alpha/beta fold hydrolase n=1 Tax=Streptomyces chartreusis TaxID=1969 RepID=UPI0036B8D43A
MNVGQRFVTTDAGAVHVRISGSGTPVLVLHSNGLSWHESVDLIAEIESEHRVIAWDMPGQGDSDPVPWDLSIDDYAAAAAQVLDELVDEPVVVVGTSVGAFIGMSLARRRPDLVAGLCLVEFQFGGASWFAEHWEAVEQLFAVPTMSREAVQARLSRPCTDARFARWNIDRNKAGSRSMLGVMWAIRRFDVVTAVRELEHPVIAVFGSAGPTVGNASAVEQSLGVAGQVALVEGAGHFVGIDQPSRLATIVRRLAATVR